MKLLLDIGNTRAKWAWLDGKSLQDAGEVAHLGRDFREVAAAMPLTAPVPQAVVAASVAGPTVTGEFAAVFRQHWGLELTLAVSERRARGVENGYTEPRQLGVDRWLALLAAHDRYRANACIVDAGTAVTIDLLRADGRHQGGLIVPGLRLMRQALHMETGGIDRAARLLASAAQDLPTIGRDTAACVQNGTVLAICGLVRYCVAEIRAAAAPAVLVLTGGDAERLIPALADLGPYHRPGLVLEGLALRHGDD